MKSFSQAGQDEFVSLLLPKPETFLDIGSAHPDLNNNTYGLELAGWTGACVDRTWRDYSIRKAITVFRDALEVDYGSLLQRVAPWIVGYLSVDTDGYSLRCLRAVLESGFRFKVITVEHDSYSRGTWLRDKEREELRGRGYRLVCEDVCHPDIAGLPVEDWWIDPLFFTESRIERATFRNCCYTKIIARMKEILP